MAFRAIFAQEAIVLVDVAITTIERSSVIDAPGVAENAIISHPVQGMKSI